MYLKGCLCLDDIPEECISEYTNRKGETKRYLNFHIYKDKVKTQKIKEMRSELMSSEHIL